MALNETETVSLREDILRLKDKLARDQSARHCSGQTTDQARVIKGTEVEPNLSDSVDGVHRMSIVSNRFNYDLKRIQLYNEDTGEYEPSLVYINNSLSSHLHDRIQQEVDEEFRSENGDYDHMVENSDNNEDHEFNDVLKEIRLDQILRPISKPSDVVENKAIKRIFQEPFLERLSNETIKIIEREQELDNMLNKTMDIFLHDDADHYAADNLGLPDYNHFLDLDANPPNGQTHQELPHGDPFFQLAKYDSDPGFEGIEKDEIEETRQLLQIALQRNEEYVRSLSEIRLGFLRANNYKEEVFKWCKEMYDNEKKENST